MKIKELPNYVNKYLDERFSSWLFDINETDCEHVDIPKIIHPEGMWLKVWGNKSVDSAVAWFKGRGVSVIYRTLETYNPVPVKNTEYRQNKRKEHFDNLKNFEVEDSKLHPTEGVKLREILTDEEYKRLEQVAEYSPGFSKKLKGDAIAGHWLAAILSDKQKIAYRTPLIRDGEELRKDVSFLESVLKKVQAEVIKNSDKKEE